jgi:hypothetical protein
MIKPDQTIISQYANSPIIKLLIEDFNEAIDPRRTIDLFYTMIWNPYTAQGYGLDVWGRIVGVSRFLKLPSNYGQYFGFHGGSGQPFNQAPFYDPRTGSKSYFVNDPTYRLMILAKAYSNITVTTIPAINLILTILFGDRGRCYAASEGRMTMHYVFEFELNDVEKAIIAQSGILPKPAGVNVLILQHLSYATFGFNGSGCQPFNQAPFNSGVIHVV